MEMSVYLACPSSELEYPSKGQSRLIVGTPILINTLRNIEGISSAAVGGQVPSFPA